MLSIVLLSLGYPIPYLVPRMFFSGREWGVGRLIVMLCLAVPPPPGKIRGASDQPRTCPLCGCIIRQARNLRRHLLTSCKYRMVHPLDMSSVDTPELIECKPSPLPSPMSTCSNLLSPPPPAPNLYAGTQQTFTSQ